MLSSVVVFDTNVYLFAYMLIYNVSLTTLFWTFFNFIITNFKSLYSFSNFSFNYYSILLFTVLLCSMAGVPPFIGFFSKVFILTLLVNSSFFLLYIVFFVILFLGLYFYIQNIRFIHSTNHRNSESPFLENERVSLAFHYFSVVSLFIIFLGVFYIDDFLLIITWVLV